MKPLLACRKCGAETRHEMQMTGLIEGIITICEPCFDTAMVEVEERRRQFDDLITGGMSREQANHVMIERINGAAAT